METASGNPAHPKTSEKEFYVNEDIEAVKDEQAIVPHNGDLQRVLRKVDYRLVPILAVLYLLCFLDRGQSNSFPTNSGPA
jgi:hypothetical protein